MGMKGKKTLARLDKRIKSYEESMKRLKSVGGYKKPGSRKK